MYYPKYFKRSTLKNVVFVRIFYIKRDLDHNIHIPKSLNYFEIQFYTKITCFNHVNNLMQKTKL